MGLREAVGFWGFCFRFVSLDVLCRFERRVFFISRFFLGFIGFGIKLFGGGRSGRGFIRGLFFVFFYFKLLEVLFFLFWGLLILYGV